MVRPPEFLAICRSCGHGTAGTAASGHPAISHTHVNGITLVLRNCYFGTIAHYYFRDVTLELNSAALLYIELPLIYGELYTDPRGV